MNKCTVPSQTQISIKSIAFAIHLHGKVSLLKMLMRKPFSPTSHASLASILNSKAAVVFHFRSFHSSLFLLRKYKSNFPIFIRPKVIFSCPNLEHPQQQQRSSYNRSQNSQLRAFSRAHTPVGCAWGGKIANCDLKSPLLFTHTHIVSVPFF